MGAACARDGQQRARFLHPAPPMPVTLHIYNIGKSRQIEMVNKFLRQLHTGAFHCGVEIYGVEWSFSDISLMPGGPTPVGSGIFSCRPRHCEGHSYAESIPMGSAAVSEEQVMELINALRKDWPISSYNTLRKNCCHFSDELCQRLGVGNIPNWVMNLAGAGAAVMDAGDTVCCKTTQGPWCCGGPVPSTYESTSYNDTDETEAVVNVVESLPVLPPFNKSQQNSRSLSSEPWDLKDFGTADSPHRQPELVGLAGLLPMSSVNSSY